MGIFSKSKKPDDESSRTINALKDAYYTLNAQTVRFRDMLSNLGTSHGGKRSTYDVYGYPQRYDFIDGYNAIRREGIASRIVKGVPRSCWRNGFEIKTGSKYEPGDTILADEINQLAQRGLFQYLERADILNRIGNFSVLFVGIGDGQDFSEPLQTARGNAAETIYFRAFAYDGVNVARYDLDPESERFGLPDVYQLEIRGRGDTEKTQQTKVIMAHHSRVVHLAENLLDNDVEGVPELEPVYNRILDIDKATGGAAEAYFRNARGKVAFEIDPEFSTSLLDDPAAKESFDEAGKKFTNDWQDQITAVGSKVSSIQTPHYSPLDTIKTALWSISGYTGMPIRILTGEGAGQYAGSEDRLTYNSLIQDRQDHTCSIWVTRLLEIFETAGLLTLPDEYIIDWPLDEPLNEMDRATLANTKADTLTKLTSAASSMGGDSINLESAMAALELDDIDIEEFDDLAPMEPPLPTAPPMTDEDPDNGA